MVSAGFPRPPRTGQRGGAGALGAAGPQGTRAVAAGYVRLSLSDWVQVVFFGWEKRQTEVLYIYI